MHPEAPSLRFGPLSEAALSDLLREELDLAPDAIAEVVPVAEGSAARALLLSQNEDFPVWRQWVERLADPDALKRVPAPSLVRSS